MVRTRIAPSPTGLDIHIGNLYTAMVNYAVAHKHNGQFIVRIEDTDRTRLVKGSQENILNSLKAFGINADESPINPGPYGPYCQSQRLEIYQKYAQQLIDKQAAYYCTCTKQRLDKLRQQQQTNKQIPKYDKHCLHKQEEIKKQIKNGATYVIRLNVPPDTQIAFNDLIRSQISINSNDLDDQILIKSDSYPTYHLAVVVDDYLMKITHVIRAEEWLASTPKHILLYKAFGWALPIFCHIPILRNSDKSKLSKRKNPVWARWYLEQGFLPKAILNYLALMGWAHPQQKEIFDFSEYIKVFDLKDVQKTGPVFDPIKLEWLNGEYIRRLNPDDLTKEIIKYLNTYKKNGIEKEIIKATIPLVQTRMKKLSDYLPLIEFILKQPTKIDFPLNYLKQCYKELLKSYEQIQWTHQNIFKKTEQISQEMAIKPVKLYMDLRLALSNQKVTAPLFESMEIIGKSATLKRLNALFT